ncbi:acid-sensing ion channel 1A-like [Hydractinia symbiolongicarpus]|uniref:acid-sensing ion channel 1A-like n=1 Tax=Hydractinia symbiolongicarpus TaxID=13093 RepID=UPI00254F9009|nr:acid-sensing ion channel 1A-like [Hydractinia symbiolongicarpus]
MESNVTTEKANQEIRKNRAKKLLSEFAENTTAHGFSQIPLTRSTWIKLFWLFAIIAGQIGFFFQMKPLILRYIKKPVITKVYHTTNTVLQFPVVTICNMNPIRKQKADALFNGSFNVPKATDAKNSITEPSFSESVQMYQIVTEEGINIENKRIILSNLSYELGNKMFKYGHQFKDIVESCNWIYYYDCMNSRFWKQYWHWNYGNCFAFNSGYTQDNKIIPPLTISQTNTLRILKLKFNINLEEYYSPLTEDSGIVLHVGGQHSAKSLTDTHYLSPGFSYLVSMEKYKRKRADPFKNNTCIKHYETDLGKQPNNDQRVIKKYSRQMCINVCAARATIKECNCSPYWLPSLNSSRRCGFKDKQCVYAVDHEYMTNNLTCLSECRLPCQETNYGLSISSAKFHLNENATVQKNKLTAFFSFKKPETVVMEDEEHYMIENLLSDIGGQLGLWSGISVLTLVEVIFFFAYSVRTLSKRK